MEPSKYYKALSEKGHKEIRQRKASGETMHRRRTANTARGTSSGGWSSNRTRRHIYSSWKQEGCMPKDCRLEKILKFMTEKGMHNHKSKELRAMNMLRLIAAPAQKLERDAS